MVTRLFAAAALLAAACDPDLADDTAIVSAARVLAVQATPAEAPPGDPVAYRALVGAADGGVADAALAWAYCVARKPITETGPVHPDCLAADAEVLVALGDGMSVEGALPKDGCELFGPDLPPPSPDEPAGRPVDPDRTGGYYQPLTVRMPGGGDVALVQSRLECGLPGATQAQASEYRERHRANGNPAIERLRADESDLVAREQDDEAAIAIGVGEEITFSVRWPSCPTGESDTACGGSEAYVWFDPQARRLVTRREAMRVSWFATAGVFASGHTGTSEAEADLVDSMNQWTAPAAAGEVHVWVVLRDDRGGAGWASYRVRVEP